MARWNAPFWLILTLLFGVHPIAADLYLPALPEIAAAFRARPGAVQWTLTVYILAFGLTQLGVGTLADRYGRRRVMLWALGLYVLASALAARADSLPQLVLCRAMLGMAAASCAVCARAAIRDRFPASAGVAVMAQGMTGMGAIALLAPLVGGLSTSVMGWHGTLALVGGFGALAWLVVYASFGETNAHALAGAPVRFRVFLAHGQFLSASLLAGASFSGAICFLLMSSFIFIGHFGMSRIGYGAILAACSLSFLIGTVCCRRLLRRLPEINAPDGAGFSFPCKARPPAHSELCNGGRNAAGERKDKSAGTFIDRNRLRSGSVPRAVRVGAALTVAGGASQLLFWLAGIDQPWALILPQCIYMLGHGFHQPCGQAGAVAPFPASAGQAAAVSGFVLTSIAFVTGQLVSASPFGATATLVGATSAMTTLIAVNAWFAVPRTYVPHAKAAAPA